MAFTRFKSELITIKRKELLFSPSIIVCIGQLRSYLQSDWPPNEEANRLLVLQTGRLRFHSDTTAESPNVVSCINGIFDMSTIY